MGLVEGKVGWAGSGQRKRRAGLPGRKGQTGQRGVAWLEKLEFYFNRKDKGDGLL
jgi:hypothetical protein